VSDMTYYLFVILEQQSRRYFSISGHCDKQRKHIVATLTSDEDVLLQWTTMIESDVANALLRHLLEALHSQHHG
jgi:hypothetical protein